MSRTVPGTPSFAIVDVGSVFMYISAGVSPVCDV